MTAPVVPALVLLGAAFVAATAEAGEVRIITAPGLTPGPRLEGTPQRIDPPKPVRPAAPIADRRLGPVVVEDGERLVVRRFRIRLPGVAAVPLDETCRDGDGVEWPCGRRALAGLRAILRLSPIVCPLPSDARGGAFDARCSLLSGADVGETFVASGWARATAEGPYGEAEARAKSAGRGVWGAAPAVPTAEPSAAAAPSGDIGVPPDVTTGPLPGGVDEPPSRAAGATAPTITGPTPMGPMRLRP